MHGAEWSGKRAGEWGYAVAYSFYATKTISTRDGGMFISNNTDLIEFAKKYRNYGKFDYIVKGLNFRINDFKAPIDVIEVKR